MSHADDRRDWLPYEDSIIAFLFERIEQWKRDGRKHPQTYFTAGLERQVALMIERATGTDIHTRELEAAKAEAKHWKDCHVARWEELAMAMNPAPTENPYEAARRVAADRELLSRDHQEAVRLLDAERQRADAAERLLDRQRNETLVAIRRIAEIEAALRKVEDTALYHAGSLPAKCQWCGWISGRHDEDCPVTTARAALAAPASRIPAQTITSPASAGIRDASPATATKCGCGRPVPPDANRGYCSDSCRGVRPACEDCNCSPCQCYGAGVNLDTRNPPHCGECGGIGQHHERCRSWEVHLDQPPKEKP